MKIKLDRWKIATIILAIVSIVLAVMLSQSMFGSADKAAQKGIEYINKYLLAEGSTATLVSVDNDKIGNLRKITIEIAGNKFGSYVSIDGKYLFASEPYDMNKDPNEGATPNTQTGSTVETTDTQLDGSFSEAKDTEVCMENGKPIVYFFGSSGCSHCAWEKPILKSVVDEFGSAISYHENIDSETDLDVFNKYSTGSVPTIVIGCKYFRVGSGENAGEESEKVSLKKIMCLATGNQPSSLCQ